MLEMISWSQYILALALALSIYYGCILWIFYRRELRAAWGKLWFSRRDNPKDPQPGSAHSSPEDPGTEHQGLLG